MAAGASSIATVHVSFLEKFSKLAQRRRLSVGEQFARHRLSVCESSSRPDRACVGAREGRIFVPTRRSIGSTLAAVIMSGRGLFHTASAAHPWKGTAGDVRVRRSLRQRRRGLPSSVSPRRGSGSRVQLRVSSAAGLSALRRTRIFLDNSTNNLFAR